MVILLLLRVVVAIGACTGVRLRHRQHRALYVQSATGEELEANSTMLIGGPSIVMVCRRC